VFGKVYGSFDDFKGVSFLYEPNLSLYKLMFVTYIVLIVNLDPCWIRLGNSSFEVGNNNLHDQNHKKKKKNWIIWAIRGNLIIIENVGLTIFYDF
jgi:hypothetical protein